MVAPYYEEPGITIFHGDCLEILPTLEGVDCIVSDPPYGMGWKCDSTSFSGGNCGPMRRGHGIKREKIIGDDKPFDPTPFLNYKEVILFGSNHYAARLPVGTTLIWIKRNDAAYGSFLSDAEIAWMKGGHGVYCRRDLSMNSKYCNSTKNYPGKHPSEKPVGIMRWCIEKCKSDLICDPYAGSGTTLRAAKDLGRKAIGIEIEERFCEIAVKRLRQEVLAI